MHIQIKKKNVIKVSDIQTLFVFISVLVQSFI